MLFKAWALGGPSWKCHNSLFLMPKCHLQTFAANVSNITTVHIMCQNYRELAVVYTAELPIFFFFIHFLYLRKLRKFSFRQEDCLTLCHIRNNYKSVEISQKYLVLLSEFQSLLYFPSFFSIRN